MAETRCANPENQLDVDIMMIDYTLYHAIDAKLKSLKASLFDGGSVRDAENQTANDLIRNFDTLLNLFRHHHPSVSKSEGTIFNIKILELLVLLGQSISGEPCSAHLIKEREFNETYRLDWLVSWLGNDHVPERNTKEWVHRSLVSIENEVSKVSLSDVFLRFADLSAEVSYSIYPVNEQWYKLAARFMLQCAVQRINTIAHTISQPDMDRKRWLPMTMWVSECFAWGIVAPSPSESTSVLGGDTWTEQRIAEQSFISDMFRNRHETDASEEVKREDEDTKMVDDNPVEDPTWTNLRTEYYSEITNLIEVLATDSSPQGNMEKRNRIRDIQVKHNPKEFLSDLCDFIDGLWRLNMSSINEKPVLVQIEEGGIKGMDDHEFREFLARVGLKMEKNSRGDGAVRWSR